MKVKSDYFTYICQNFYYLASILANIKNLIILVFYHLAITLTNVN